MLKIAEGELKIRPGVLRDVLCTVLRTVQDRSNFTEYPNVWQECQTLIEGAPWYRVYDFVEALYHEIWSTAEANPAEEWAELVNEYFLEAGVGWRLVHGRLERRGEEAFQSAVDSASAALNNAGLSTAQGEIHEALHDLSRRPNPDLTGAIHHALGALECTAREAANDPKATLGEIIKRHPGILPKPLDDALTKIWGYASEAARHVREGNSPSLEEAELVVGVSAASCSYLAAIALRSRRS